MGDEMNENLHLRAGEWVEFGANAKFLRKLDKQSQFGGGAVGNG
jgi:hypothetical protein